MPESCLTRRAVLLGGLAALAGCDTPDNRADTLDLRVEGTRLRLDGVINTAGKRDFFALWDDNRQVREIVLGRIDGSYDDGSVVEMGYAIREAGLTTRMLASSEVYSGGVDLHLAGVQRFIAPGAVVGVHEWEDAYGTGREYPRGSRQHEPTRGYIEDMLGSDAFYWFTLDAAPWDGVHVMSRNEMFRYGLITT